MIVRLLRRNVVCEDCGGKVISRIACTQGHYFCIPCSMARINKADDAIDISRITEYPRWCSES